LKLSLTEGFDGDLNNKHMLADKFRRELENFNSPEKTRGRITSRNSECKTPTNYTFFQKYVPKSRKNSEILKKKSFKFNE